jgi:iron(III) transport system ATP-binding protein
MLALADGTGCVRMAGLSLNGVVKRFGGSVAVDGVDLAVADGEFLAVLGPSGCGKTTLLRLIAGFERPDAGTVAIGDAVVSGPGVFVPPERRRVGIVFQNYALWPHMTVEGNVGYPLRTAGVRGEAYRGRVMAALAAVGLTGFGDRRPAHLSGGQRQRVALARCLVMEPSLVLLDEPLANLDVHLRATMEAEFAAFHAKTRATMVYITHDQAEAMALADRIAVMDAGRVVQVAAPRTLYREPATPMVAGFIGRGALVPVTVIGTVEAGAARIVWGAEEVRVRAAPGQRPGPALLCVRPEDLAIGAEGAPGTVRRIVYKGGATSVEVDVGGAVVTLSVPDGAIPQPGAGVSVSVGDGWIVPASDPITPAMAAFPAEAAVRMPSPAA